jgi:hypothetical protein
MYMFCRSLFFFCTFSFGHCVCSSIYVFWLPLWYLQTLRLCMLQAVNRNTTSGTRRVNLVTNQVIHHEWRKDREVLTTSGTYPWSLVTRIFHNGQPSHGGDRKIFEVMTSFHSYVATFQQHMHMEYISLNGYHIPELVVPIRISLIEGCC